MLKTHNLLKPFVIVTRSLYQPHATAQIPRHTGLLPGQFQGLTGQMIGRLAAPVTQTNSTAVPLGFTTHRINLGMIFVFSLYLLKQNSYHETLTYPS
jgi:hypothetical protein